MNSIRDWALCPPFWAHACAFSVRWTTQGSIALEFAAEQLCCRWMKFGPLQKAHFGAKDGAYSQVTEDERKKGQLTLTTHDGESQLVLDHLGKANVPRGAVRGRKTRLRTISRVGLKDEGELSLNFAKATGDELRLYRGVEAGFDFEAGDIWFVFVGDDGLVVGSMTETEWRSIGSYDENDAEYQQQAAAGATAPVETTFLGTRYSRDPGVARAALKNASYACEYDPQTELFISRATGLSYLEAHHLIPLFATPEFGRSLDVAENVVALSPHWHRAVHHANPELVREVLEVLWLQREKSLCSAGFQLDLDSLVRLYGVEEI